MVTSHAILWTFAIITGGLYDQTNEELIVVSYVFVLALWAIIVPAIQKNINLDVVYLTISIEKYVQFINDIDLNVVC